ncbi:MAG: 2-iminobutanoate/2-iminopropanoate deaminase [Planctomycetota bacterium]|jgi:2-iminobutanoate/2-iminopropanoate deaminase
MKKRIKTEKVAAAPAILSQAIEANGLLFVSGQIGVDIHWKLVEGGIEAETRQVMENIKTILEAADSNMDNIAKVTIYVTDITNGKIINEVYSSYFNEPLPAREMIEAKALPLGANIEISVIAAK